MARQQHIFHRFTIGMFVRSSLETRSQTPVVGLNDRSNPDVMGSAAPQPTLVCVHDSPAHLKPIMFELEQQHHDEIECYAVLGE